MWTLNWTLTVQYEMFFQVSLLPAFKKRAQAPESGLKALNLFEQEIIWYIDGKGRIQYLGCTVRMHWSVRARRAYGTRTVSQTCGFCMQYIVNGNHLNKNGDV